MKKSKPKTWTPQEIEYLQHHFPNQLTADIARHLGCTYAQVSRKAATMGLYKTKELRRRLAHNIKESGKQYRFKKGNTAWNKGLSVDIGGKATRFKKGNIPHNTKADGHISIRVDKEGRSYKFIRIAKAKWVPLHRQLWREHYGDIPPGHIVSFVDGNTLNCHIDNLILITKQKNMKLNTIHRLPPQIKEAINTVIKLNKTIKKVSNA